jgi:hypothetical protein
MLREALKRRTDYGSILAAREPGSRYWHRWCDCADERQEEEGAVTDRSTSESSQEGVWCTNLRNQQQITHDRTLGQDHDDLRGSQVSYSSLRFLFMSQRIASWLRPSAYPFERSRASRLVQCANPAGA